MLGSMGGLPPHDSRKMMRWYNRWDAEPRRASKPFGKPWKVVTLLVNHLELKFFLEPYGSS